VNDSFSTTPEATIAAIGSFSQPVVLICGGKSKGGDYQKMIKAICQKTVKSVILIGEMSDKLAIELEKVNAPHLRVIKLGFASMKEIVDAALENARPGEVVLFSPGCASFDMFQNASQRGKLFKEAVLAQKELFKDRK